MAYPPRVHLTTLGCSKNQVDSEKIVSLLGTAGYLEAESIPNADVVMVNTCAFIEDARRESVDVILDVAEAKRDDARLVVIGDADVVSNRYLNLMANREFCISVAHWLTDQETYLKLAPPPVSFVPPKVGLRTMRSFFYMVTFGLPAIFVLAGFFVWLRRRGLGGI